MTTRIKKMVISMARRYPAICEITYRWGNKITDDDPKNDGGDNTDSNYDPANDASNTSDTPPDTPKNTSPDDDSIYYRDYKMLP